MVYQPKNKTNSGLLQANGWEQLGALMEQYGDNEQIAGIITGALVDGALTGLNMGNNLQFESGMAELQMQLTTQLEELKTANQIELIDAEGQMAGDLIGKQGEWKIKTDLAASQNKINEIGVTSQANINQINAQGAVDINKMNVKGDWDTKLQEQKGRLDRELTKTKGSEDRLTWQTRGEEERKGIKVKGDQEVRAIGAKGDEQRKTDTNKTDQEIRLRTDARGQTAKQGAKFFG